jgi:hypothetical protein
MRHHVAKIHQRNIIAQQLVRSGEHVVDPMAIAICNSTCLTSIEIDDKIEPMRLGVKAMTLGKGSFANWVCLCSGLHVAMAIEHFGIVRGYKEALAELKEVLDAIGNRAGETAANWKPPTLYAHEIKVLRLQCSDHKFQLSQLSYGEFIQAYDYAVNKCRAEGGEVFKAGDLQ